MIKKIIFCSTLLSTLLFINCGGGGGGGITSFTGQYIDAPVKGLSYTATPSGLTGTTDSSGNFAFQAGDTVTFSIVTPGGNVSAGSVAPATPSSATTSVPVSVMALSGGTQIAQTLQSLGGVGSSIDVSANNANVAAISSSALVTQINNFVSSAGSTAQPPAITVSATTAFQNAMTSISAIQTPTTQTISNIITGSTVFHTGPMTSATINGSADTSLKYLNSAIGYFSSDNKSYSICINTPILANPNHYSFTPSCSGTGNSVVNSTSETWSIDTSANVLSFASSGSTTNVTFPYIDKTTGIYNLTANSSSSTWTGTGMYYVINNAITQSSFAGKTVTIAGNSNCSDGLMNYVINSSGSSYTNSCKTSALTSSSSVLSSPSSSSASGSGTIATVTNLPGLIQFTDSSTSTTLYIGQVNGSSLSAGRFAVAQIGDSACYGSNSNSSNHCGFMQIFNYTAQ